MAKLYKAHRTRSNFSQQFSAIFEIEFDLVAEARRTRGNFSEQFRAIFSNLHMLVAKKMAKKVAKKLQPNCYMCDV